MTDPKHLENCLHEKEGPAYNALTADLDRTVTLDRVRYTLDELLAQCDPSADLAPQEREWQDAPSLGREVLTPFDPAECLDSAEAIAFFLEEAKATGNPDFVVHAHEIAGRARTMHGLK